MDWYLGSVNDAIKHCLEQKALLIVYIHHPESENNNSTAHFNSLWENFDNSSIVQLNYVALKLEHNSEGSKQFAAIFPTPIVPACYVIGLGGKPLEIITTVEELTLEKLNASVKKAAELYEQQFMEFLSKPASPPSATSDDANAAAAVSSEDVPQTDSQGQEIPLEDRVILARQKIAEKRKLDEEKKKQEEHEKELRRIKEGKLMQESKERSKENEIREAAEERRKQKQADQETLRRLREQIRLDKEARAQKASGGVPKEPEEEKPSTAAEPVINKPVATDECRIQCKFPDGSTLIKQFKSDSPLQVVIDAVKEDGRMPGEFFLVQTYPRKQLTEYDKSLLDHGLTPASALLVVSGTLLSGPPGGGIVSTTSGYLSFFIGLLYSPIMAIYQFMLSLIGMGPSTTKRDPQKPGPSNSSNPRDAEQSTSSELRRRRAGNNENRNLVRMEGNTARLRNPDDSSDDEKATWNGNSTQQL